MEKSRPKSGGTAQKLADLRALINDYPRQFWILVFGSFIDRLDGALLFPFFSLYITRKFTVGMTEVGVIFGIFALTGLVSSVLGGALTDHIGRKGIIIFGLLMSAVSALLMGLIERFELFLVMIDIDESNDPDRLRVLLSHSLATHSAASLESTGSQR